MYLKPEKGKYKDLEKDMPIKREYKRAYKPDKKCGCDSSRSCCNQRRKNRCN